MHNVILLVLFFIIDSIVLRAAFMVQEKGFFSFLFLVSIAIAAFWIGCVCIKIKELMEDQIKDLQALESAENKKEYNIAELEKDMEATAKALNDYKEEMKPVLVDKYEAFEKTLMENVRDSKLIATMLRKSGYSDLLNRYDTRIDSFIDTVKKKTEAMADQERACLHTKLDAHNSLVARRSQGIFGYHYFFPKHLRYTETEAPSED